jgi:hypothetical protein
MNRADAFALVTEYTKNPSLIKHMLAVEAAIRANARKLGQDEERWDITGVLPCRAVDRRYVHRRPAGRPIRPCRGTGDRGMNYCFPNTSMTLSNSSAEG